MIYSPYMDTHKYIIQVKICGHSCDYWVFGSDTSPVYTHTL